MATHSSVLAWKIPGTEEPGTLLGCLWGRTESDTTEVTQQQPEAQGDKVTEVRLAQAVRRQGLRF